MSSHSDGGYSRASTALVDSLYESTSINYVEEKSIQHDNKSHETTYNLQIRVDSKVS